MHNLPRRHWEDGRHFHHNREHIHSVAECFTEPTAWHGGAEATYRPLSANLYYFAGRKLFGNRLEVYHTIDALAHLVNAVLLLLLCRELLPWPGALLPPMLFVSRLAHEQDIVYTSNFDTLSYAALGVAGLLLFVRARRAERKDLEVVAVCCFGLALLCKEGAIVWPAILLGYGCLFDRVGAWRRYLAACLLATGWVVAYRHMIHRLYPAATPGFALDFHPLNLLGRYSAYLLSFLNGLVPKVDPEQAGWALPPRIAEIATTAPVLLVTASLVIVTVGLVAWSRVRPASMSQPARVAAFGLIWFWVGTAPYAVLADRLFMRYSYVGHAGLAMALGGFTAAAGGPAWANIKSVLRHVVFMAKGTPPTAAASR